MMSEDTRKKGMDMIGKVLVPDYAGWPNAMAALRTLNEVWPEED